MAPTREAVSKPKTGEAEPSALSGLSAAGLLALKVARMQDVLDVTRQELLLVDLEGLTPLLEQKNTLIGELQRIDGALAALGDRSQPPPTEAARLRSELDRLITAVLENERTLEVRIEQEHQQLRQE